jgi:hypothetical protein
VLTSTGAASGLQTLYHGRALISRSTLTTPNEFFIISELKDLESSISSIPDDEDVVANYKGSVIKLWSPLTSDDSLNGKSLSEGESFYFKGEGDVQVHGWLLRPYGYDKKEAEAGKKWPVVFLIHGGPQGAWEDQWSTRWNPAVWAGQGYFIVAINPRGSTSFGQGRFVRFNLAQHDCDTLSFFQSSPTEYPKTGEEKYSSIFKRVGSTHWKLTLRLTRIVLLQLEPVSEDMLSSGCRSLCMAGLVF